MGSGHLRLMNFFRLMAGEADRYGSGTRAAKLRGDAPNFHQGRITGGKVDTIGSDSQGYVEAGIDEQASAVSRRSQCRRAQDSHGFQGDDPKFACAQVFFAELDVVDRGLAGFGDFLQQVLAAVQFVPGKLRAIGDVAEQRSCRHRVTRIILSVSKTLASNQGRRTFEYRKKQDN